MPDSYGFATRGPLASRGDLRVDCLEPGCRFLASSEAERRAHWREHEKERRRSRRAEAASRKREATKRLRKVNRLRAEGGER